MRNLEKRSRFIGKVICVEFSWDCSYFQTKVKCSWISANYVILWFFSTLASYDLMRLGLKLIFEYFTKCENQFSSRDPKMRKFVWKSISQENRLIVCSSINGIPAIYKEEGELGFPKFSQKGGFQNFPIKRGVGKIGATVLKERGVSLTNTN